jgi:hypothetical protein
VKSLFKHLKSPRKRAQKPVSRIPTLEQFEAIVHPSPKRRFSLGKSEPHS